MEIIKHLKTLTSPIDLYNAIIEKSEDVGEVNSYSELYNHLYRVSCEAKSIGVIATVKSTTFFKPTRPELVLSIHGLKPGDRLAQQYYSDVCLFDIFENQTDFTLVEPLNMASFQFGHPPFIYSVNNAENISYKGLWVCPRVVREMIAFINKDVVYDKHKKYIFRIGGGVHGCLYDSTNEKVSLL